MQHECMSCHRVFPTFLIAMHHYITAELGIWSTIPNGTTVSDLYIWLEQKGKGMTTLKDLQTDFDEKDRHLRATTEQLKQSLRSASGPLSLGGAVGITLEVKAVVELCNILQEADAARLEAAKAVMDARLQRRDSKQKRDSEALCCPPCHRVFASIRTLRVHLNQDRCGWSFVHKWAGYDVDRLVELASRNLERRKKDYAAAQQRRETKVTA